MKLLFALPGFHREERGAEVALLAVADALARSGDEVTVAGAGQDRAGTAYRFQHIRAAHRTRFERWPHFPPFRSETAWEDASFAWGLRQHFRMAEFDATVTCSYPFTHWALQSGAGSKSPLNIFVTQNGDWPAFSNKAEFRFFRCDGLVCTNPDYEERNRDRWETALIPNGIDPARYANIAANRADFGLPDGVPLVLMVSAFIDSKRVLDGMRAVAALPGVHFAVAGDGPLRSEVDALASAILPGRFTRLTLPATDMPRLYACADAFLHMSLEESFGNVFVEAMASGLPIVGHDTPRLQWIVGQRNTLCDSRDSGAVSAALSRAIVTGRGAADPRAADFGWDRIAQLYRAFITRLIDARSAQKPAA
jgi:glycosyltransferase involved in cell wall biosynthesis